MKNYTLLRIYIPIWLDLLFANYFELAYSQSYLHSNMVRFIIGIEIPAGLPLPSFTFQYG